MRFISLSLLLLVLLLPTRAPAQVLPTPARAQGLFGPFGMAGYTVSDAPLSAPDSKVSPPPLQLRAPMESATPEGWDYLKPVGWILFSNTVFWAVARFGMQAHYAYISPATMADNFRNGWEWDADAFPTNQLGHPYQGGLYHTGARAVGFSFWEAIPYTFLGSLHWEMLMETERPSYNDLVTTTVGGVVLGEVLFRLASSVLDESSTGTERALREGGALAISPIYGISRLLSGDARRPGAGAPRVPGALRVGLGFNNLRPAEADEGVRHLGLSARTVYGDFVDDGRPFRPFDWFTLGAGMNFRYPDFQAAEFDLTGLLARWGFYCGAKNDCAVGPSMHYDYYRTPVFSVGTSAYGASAMGRFDLGFWSLHLYAGVDLHVVALGGFDSPYAEVVERDYNLGAGGFTRTILMLTKPDWFELRIFNSRYYVRTLHGAAGNEFAGIFRTELELPIAAGFGVSLGNVIYDREGFPRDYPDIQSTHIAQQFQVFWRSRYGWLL